MVHADTKTGTPAIRELICSNIPQLQVSIFHLSDCSYLSQLMVQGD